jgi:hypothetical protein
MAGRSELVRQLDKVQRVVGAVLGEAGFGWRGRTLARILGGDLVQVLALQAGPFEPGPALSPAAAYLRPDLYGLGAVNLGVFVPQIHAHDSTVAPRVSEPHCAIRTQLGRSQASGDLWWSLAGDREAVARDVTALLVHDGLPFLDRFGSRAAIRRDWVRVNEGEGRLTLVARLDVAMMMLAAGEVDEARDLFEQHLAMWHRDPRNPGHVPMSARSPAGWAWAS